jgi:hypothetical protein
MHAVEQAIHCHGLRQVALPKPFVPDGGRRVGGFRFKEGVEGGERLFGHQVYMLVGIYLIVEVNWIRSLKRLGYEPLPLKYN